MTIVPLAARHLIEVACGSEEDSRASVSALSECARSLVCQEGVGQSFNQTLLQPFQAIVCSDRCSTETRAQLVDTLSEFVHKKADRLGSGWKPLFGALRAVRTSDGAEEGLHWTVLDVISTYLRLNKCAVLSWSLPDCLPCIVHFLQETTPVEKEEGEKPSKVPMGVRPWEEAEAHRLAAVELLLELVEQLAGVLITAAASVQAQLLSALQELISTIRQSEIGPAPAAFCVSSLILPHIQKWMRRSGSSRDPAVQRNMRHAIGICAQIAVDFIQLNPGGAWELRLLSDTLRLATECAAQPSGASRVGVACLRHFDTVLEQFEFAQWTIMAKALWDTCCVTLAPLRLLLSTFLPDGNDDGGDIGHIARDLDKRPGARTMIGRLLRLREANLCGQMTIAGAGKMNCLMGMGIARMREGEQATLEHLGRLLSALMTQLERLERVTVRQRIAAETREHREEKFVFMLVENADFEEKTYRLVGEDQMDETLNEYKKQRPIGIQPKRIDARKNPFVAAINAERQSAELEEAPPLCLLRLVAWRTVICLPLKGYLKLSQTDRPLFDKALPLILPSLKSLLVATPDLAVRRLALSYIELLAEK
ncbi:unnamed protein product, partial [Mesorhabditis spiculigera]